MTSNGRYESESWPGLRLLSVAGAGGVAIAAFLPWLSVSFLGFSGTVTGIDADGRITLGAAVIVAVAVSRQWTRETRLLSVLAGAAGLTSS